MHGTETNFLKSFVDALNRTERYLLMLFYAEQLTTAEIGLVLDLGEPRVVAMLDDLKTRARSALTEVRQEA